MPSVGQGSPELVVGESLPKEGIGLRLHPYVLSHFYLK